MVAATTSSARADSGIFLNPCPSPIIIEPLSTVKLPVILTLPVNSEPLSKDITLNPKLGDTEAVTEPDLISVLISASSVRAVLGIFLK